MACVENVGGLTIRYSGPSMSPTFFTNDVLTYVQVPYTFLRPGDIVLFSSRDYPGEKVIIHRVKGVRTEGIVTQGDNNDLPDREIMTPENFIGMVISAKRAGNGIPVQSGTRGHLQHHYLQYRKRIILLCLPILIKLELLLKGKYPLSFLVPGLISGKVIGIRTSEGIDLQFYLGRFLAAWMPHDRSQWYIRPYFRLFIDPCYLPHGPEEVFPAGETIRREYQ
jgi:signal peptidase I